MNIMNLKEEFNEIYGDGESKTFFSPLMISIMGEHLIYNGGKILTTTSSLGFYGVARERSDSEINIVYNEDLKISLDIKNIKLNNENDLENIICSTVESIKERGYKILGMDILINGNIPYKEELRCNSSLEMLMVNIVNTMFNEGKIPVPELVNIFENTKETKSFGFNDEKVTKLAIIMGQNEKAIVVQCDTLKSEQVNINLIDYTIVVMDTNKECKDINKTLYDRKNEVESALEIIKTYKNINFLWDLSTEEFEKLEFNIDSELLRKRAKHIITENERVNKAVEAIKSRNMRELGTLMVLSHNSLERWYEVTGIELDTIVDEALRAEGCIGAKMIGDGLGGCAIALVHKSYLNKFINRVEEKYTAKIGYVPSFYL